MDTFNRFMRREEYDVLCAFIKEHGILKEYKKEAYFIAMGAHACKLGIVLKGCFRYYTYDAEGRNSTITYGFVGDVVSSYSCMMMNCPSVVCIDALDDSEVIEITYSQLMELYQEYPQLRAVIAEVLLLQRWKENIEIKSGSLHGRYQSLKERCPRIEQLISQKEIASFLGITPEYFSNLRKKLTLEEVKDIS